MTPVQKVRWMIILKAHQFAQVTPPEITAENVDELYAQYDDENCEVGYQMQDAHNEVRCSGESSGLGGTPYSRAMRDYDYHEVAAQAPDGSWVGWTYWHGGGRHGEPQAIDWISGAYDLACQEREVMVIERDFTRT